MTFEEIDRALTTWNQRLAAIADNLLELQEDPTYQLLTGAGRGPAPTGALQLTGQTAARVLPALQSIETIFHQFSLLQTVVERAAQLRRDLPPVFVREQALREIQGVLEGESIELPAVAVPLGERTLLGGLQSARTVRPDTLLETMVRHFAEARDAVLSVSEAWSELALEVDAAEAEMRTLRELVAAGSCAAPPELHRAAQLFDAVKARIQNDPLGACAELRDRLAPALDAASHRLQAHAAVQEQLCAARALLDRLQGLEDEIAAATSASRTKILAVDTALDTSADTHVDAGAKEQLGHLGAWLVRLEQRGGDESPETMFLGLRNWHRVADAQADQAPERLRLCRLPLETRGELRGRLDALKAKARVYGMAEDAAITSLARSAEDLLYTQPTDLVRAAAALEAYEHRLIVPTRIRHKTTGSNEERQ